MGGGKYGLIVLYSHYLDVGWSESSQDTLLSKTSSSVSSRRRAGGLSLESHSSPLMKPG